MNDNNARIADALLQAQAIAPPAQGVQPPAPADPYQLNQALEQAAQPSHPPMHPLIAALMNHLGMLSAIRNRTNQPLIDPEAPAQ